MKKGTTFTIAVSKDEAVREAIRGLGGWKPYSLQDGTATDREIAQTVHTMNETREAFRLVVLRWKNRQADLFDSAEYCYHAIATSAEEAVWEYNGRGQAENIIGEHHRRTS